MISDVQILSFVYFLDKLQNIMETLSRDIGDRYINYTWISEHNLNIEYGFSDYEEHYISTLNVNISSNVSIDKNSNISSVYSETGNPYINDEKIILKNLEELKNYIVFDYFQDQFDKIFDDEKN